MQRNLKWFAVLLLVIFRNVYCWLLFSFSFTGSWMVCASILRMMRSHTRGDIYNNTILAISSIVWGIAWWMILRGKPTSNKWAIAANVFVILNYLPELAFWILRGFLKSGSDWRPISIGIFGIIIFSIPYHGRRHKSQIPVSSLRIMKRIGVSLLAICRTLYCFILFILSPTGIYVACTNILSMVRSHTVDRMGIYSYLTIAIYSVIFGITWWMIFREKPKSKQWAIAANPLLSLPMFQR